MKEKEVIAETEDGGGMLTQKLLLLFALLDCLHVTLVETGTSESKKIILSLQLCYLVLRGGGGVCVCVCVRVCVCACVRVCVCVCVCVCV